MNTFKWIIFFLLVIIFLLYIHLFGKKQTLEEGLLDLMDKTVFGQNVDNLKLANKNLETSLDKIDKTYSDLKSNEHQQFINMQKIKEKTDEVTKISQLIAEEYKLITNSVQPIMFLKLGNSIRNDAISDNIIDKKIENILKTTIYNIVTPLNSNTSLTSYHGKHCLYLSGRGDQGVFFSVIPTLTQFSFSFWIYNENNNDPVISIMNETDFNKKEPKSGLKIYIKNNQVEVQFNDNLLTNSLNNGWNHITFTTGNTSSCIYINGQNIKSSMYTAMLKPMPNSYDTLYRLKTYFIIGRTNFKGYIYNIRYYAIEIPPKVVLDVYNLDVTTNANS